MREIKFRAWDKNKKVFIPTDVWAICQTDFRAFGVMLKDWEDYREGEYFYERAQELQQFTGLYDKNGKEIYEGDVVMWKYSTLQSDSFMHMVLWDAKWACFGMFEAGNQWCKESDWHRITDREVVGNIYENPELVS